MTPKDIKDIVPLDKFYEDALRPAMKQIGYALESVAKTSRFLLAPIDYLACQHDRWQRHLTKVSERVKDEDLIEGQAQIVIPVLEGLSLSQENSLLSELFINLLSNTIDRTKQDLAHPAFPSIIKQLSHDEAVILYCLKKQIMVVGVDTEGAVNPRTNLPYFVSAIQVLTFPEHLVSYMGHLRSLNIVKQQYSILGNNISMQAIDYVNTGFAEGELTTFGWLFAKSCVPDDFPDLGL